MMKQLLALTLTAALGHATTSFAAGAPPLSVASSQPPANRSGAAPSSGPQFVSFAELARVGAAAQHGGALAQSSGSVSSSGLKKRTKLLLYVGAAAAVLGVSYGIDHHVKDITPSTLGTREDKNR